MAYHVPLHHHIPCTKMIRSAASNNSSAIALSLLVATAYLILFTSRYCISWYTPFFTGIPYCSFLPHYGLKIISEFLNRKNLFRTPVSDFFKCFYRNSSYSDQKLVRYHMSISRNCLSHGLIILSQNQLECHPYQIIQLLSSLYLSTQTVYNSDAYRGHVLYKTLYVLKDVH